MSFLTSVFQNQERVRHVAEDRCLTTGQFENILVIHLAKKDSRALKLGKCA